MTSRKGWSGTPARHPAYVAVVGPGESDVEAERHAEEIGRQVARRGAVLVCGGLGGAMEAAASGAKSEDGLTVGILPTDDRSVANPYIDVALPTGIGEMRNVLIVRAADALIAVGGGFGTLSEVAFALKLGKPVVGLDTWELAKGGRAEKGVVVAAGPEEAVEVALRLSGVG